MDIKNTEAGNASPKIERKRPSSVPAGTSGGGRIKHRHDTTPIAEREQETGRVVEQKQDTGPVVEQEQETSPVIEQEQDTGPVVGQEQDTTSFVEQEQDTGPVKQDETGLIKQEHVGGLTFLYRWNEMLKPDNLETVFDGSSGYVSKGSFIYKQNAGQREFDLQKEAGDCAMRPFCMIRREMGDGHIMQGILMKLGTAFKVTEVPASDRAAVKDELTALVTRLHEQHGIIHGDLKSMNFVRHPDGTLRFCDFEFARWIDDDGSEWQGTSTLAFTAPDRAREHKLQPPQVRDDLYALGVTIWELYTGKKAFVNVEGPEIEKILKKGETVDLALIEDDEVRAWVREKLLLGGAKLD